MQRGGRPPLKRGTVRQVPVLTDGTEVSPQLVARLGIGARLTQLGHLRPSAVDEFAAFRTGNPNPDRRRPLLLGMHGYTARAPSRP